MSETRDLSYLTSSQAIDLTEDILKALRWIRDNGNILGFVSYEAFIAQGLHKGSTEYTEGYTVSLPEGSVKVEVPQGSIGISIRLTQAGRFILDATDKMAGRQ